MRLAMLILAAAAAFTEEAPAMKKAPEIPAALEAKFWRAQTKFLAILPTFESADAKVKEARAELDKVCGKEYALDDQDGLKCVPKPQPPAPQPAKEAKKK